MIRYLTNRHEEAVADLEQQLRICEAIGYKRGSSIALSNLGTVHGEQGDWQRALECYQRDTLLCEELGDKGELPESYFNLGVAQFETGHAAEGERLLRRAIELSLETGNDYYRCNYLAVLAEYLVHGGRAGEAEALAAEGRSLAQATNRVDAQRRAAIALALAHAAADRGRGERELRQLLHQAQDDQAKAPPLYELFRLTGSSDYRSAALTVYSRLAAGHTRRLYRDRIAELKG